MPTHIHQNKHNHINIFMWLTHTNTHNITYMQQLPFNICTSGHPLYVFSFFSLIVAGICCQKLNPICMESNKVRAFHAQIYSTVWLIKYSTCKRENDDVSFNITNQTTITFWLVQDPFLCVLFRVKRLFVLDETRWLKPIL